MIWNGKDETKKKSFGALFPLWSRTVPKITVPGIFINEVSQ